MRFVHWLIVAVGLTLSAVGVFVAEEPPAIVHQKVGEGDPPVTTNGGGCTDPDGRPAPCYQPGP